MSTKALDRAITIVGGQSILARELAVRTGKPIRQGHVWAWRNRTGKVPAEMASHIEAITTEKGTPISRVDLCPDFPWQINQYQANA